MGTVVAKDNTSIVVVVKGHSVRGVDVGLEDSGRALNPVGV